MNVFLYGPPGAGKSEAGRLLARRMRREFVDLDGLIVSRTGRSIASWFEDGEAAFRVVEATICRELAAASHLVVALGGGALLDAVTRAAVARDHVVICLHARIETLAARLRDGVVRPLLTGPDSASALAELVAARAAVYESFPEQIDTSDQTAREVADLAWSVVRRRALSIRRFRQRIVIGYGLAEDLPALVADRSAEGPFVVVTDEHVRVCQASRMPAGWPIIVVPPGEASKSFDQLATLSRELVRAGLERRGTIVAIGGGVVGDLAGFAAATFMRGVRWVSVPTSLVAMVDASVGGKTGIDLPEGKNLVGAFHAASLVVVDPLLLGTLPERERMAGMAEVVKHAVIGDAALFGSLERGRPFGAIADLRAAIEVKRAIVERDPLERGEREILNLGHTIGHGVEAASDYALLHGEAVAIGLAGETRLAARLGLAAADLASRIAAALKAAGLAVDYEGGSAARVREAMGADKKRSGGRLRFALPRDIAHVSVGVEAAEPVLMDVLNELCPPRNPA